MQCYHDNRFFSAFTSLYRLLPAGIRKLFRRKNKGGLESRMDTDGRFRRFLYTR